MDLHSHNPSAYERRRPWYMTGVFFTDDRPDYWPLRIDQSINQSIKNELIIVAQNRRLLLGHFTRMLDALFAIFEIPRFLPDQKIIIIQNF